MANNIQDLRREAGYRNAKDFAAALGIPASTYSRYESQPESIPLKQAWAIADFLGCSIDVVVGREHVDADAMRGDVQKFYDGLSEDGRESMDDYMDYLAHREKKARKRARKESRRRYRDLLERYKTQFEAAQGGDAPFGLTIVYRDPDDQRATFRSFLERQASAKLESDISVHLEGLEEELREGYLDADGTHHDMREDEIARQLEAERAQLTIEYEPRDREVIDGIMEAYDEQGSSGRAWLEYLSGAK